MNAEPDSGTAAAVPDERVPPEIAAAWKRSEELLYLTALGDVGLYQRVMTLVGATLEHLRTGGFGVADLVAVARRGGDLLAEAVQGQAPGTAGIDPHLVASAALALRHRELVAEQTARRRLGAIDEARRRGETRAVLEESGDFAGSLVRPYGRLEADVTTGRALRVSATPDEEFRRCVHAVEALQVDFRTGALRELDDGGVAPEFSTDELDRERSAARAWEALTGVAHPQDVHHSEQNQGLHHSLDEGPHP